MTTNFEILHTLWHMIREAKVFSWPVGGVSFGNVDTAVLERFLDEAVPTYEKEGDNYFFPEPIDCERHVINTILLASHENMLSLFMVLHFDKSEDSAISTQDAYALFLRWLREYDISAGLAPKRGAFLHRLEEMGYERCKYRGGTGIYGVRLKHLV